MSTKIDTGFKFVPDYISGVTNVVQSITPAIEALQRERYVQAFARLLVSLLDGTQEALSTDVRDGLQEHVPTHLVREVIRRRQGKVRATFERDPAVDVEVQLRCWYSTKLNHFLGYVTSEFSHLVLNTMHRAGAIVDYAFWDNGDPDPAVSQDEWAQRSREWGNILSGKSGAGFQFIFPGDVSAFMPSWPELEKALPSLEVRAEELAIPALYTQWSRANPLSGDRSPMSVLAHTGAFRTLLREDPALKSQLAAGIEMRKTVLLTGQALNESMRRQQLVKVPRQFE